MEEQKYFLTFSKRAIKRTNFRQALTQKHVGKMRRHPVSGNHQTCLYVLHSELKLMLRLVHKISTVGRRDAGVAFFVYRAQ